MKQIFTLLFLSFYLFTDAQTIKLVKDITPGSGSSEIKIHGAFNKKIIFSVIKNNGWDLMISDATEENTKVLKSFASDETFVKVLPVSTDIIMIATSQGWTTTLHNVDIEVNTLETKCSFSLFGKCTALTKYKGIYWAIGDGVLWELDTVSCQAEGLFSDDEMFGLEVYKDHLYTVAASEESIYIVKTDGTFLGSDALKNFSGNSKEGPKFIEFNKLNDKLTFTIDNNHSGDGLYITDGTEAGTKLLKSFSWYENVENASENLMEVVDNKLYFAARPQYIQSGFRELYVSDGTTGGTTKIDFTQNDGMDPKYLTSYNNELNFYGGVDSKIYKTSGSVPVLAYDDDFIQGFYGTGTKYGISIVPFNDKLIFTGNSPNFGKEIMEGGTAASGFLLYNFSSGATGIEPEQMTPAGDKLMYFVGKNSDSGKELYVYEPKITVSTITLNSFAINVFPNPTSGLISFTEEFKNSNAIVTDANGGSVMSLKLNSNILDLQNIPSGLYFLTITNDSGVYTAKIIKH